MTVTSSQSATATSTGDTVITVTSKKTITVCPCDSTSAKTTAWMNYRRDAGYAPPDFTYGPQSTTTYETVVTESLTTFGKTTITLCGNPSSSSSSSSTTAPTPIVTD